MIKRATTIIACIYLCVCVRLPLLVRQAIHVPFQYQSISPANPSIEINNDPPTPAC